MKNCKLFQNVAVCFSHRISLGVRSFGTVAKAPLGHLTHRYAWLLLATSVVTLSAQDSETPVEATPSPASASEPRQSSPSSRDDSAGVQSTLDSFNLGSGAMDWRGKQFNLGDAEMAQARFEKYLNSPPSTSEEDLTYDTLLTEISHRLIGKGGGTDKQRVSEAWRMLYRASEFPMDAGLSEILADRIVSFWQTNNKVAALGLQTERLETDRQYRESKIRSIADQDRHEFIRLTRGTGNQDAAPPPSMDHLSEPERKRLEQIEEKIEENESYEATSRITQKLEYQSLIVQFFVQRRFQHALIANDFYRYMFNAEDNALEGADALKGQVFGDLDVKITTSTLDALSKEAVSDVESSLDTINFLLEQGEIHNATKRLMEAFYLGEYLPVIKRYPLDKKRKIAGYIRDLTSLASSLEVKSFDRAEKKLEEIEGYVQDFDGGKADAFIQTSKQLSNLAIQRALSAAYEQDRSGIEAGLEEAVKYWPTNPGIQEFSNKLLEKTDIKDMAALDFDRFIKQDDYRAIFNDRFRFAAALAMDEGRNVEFLDIMKRMEVIESAMAQAQELSRIQNTFGAWEVLERVYREYPEDQELNRLRGDYAVKAAQFASVIAKAEQARKKEDFGQALFAYLEAQKLYPASFFVEEGIQESVDAILEDRSDLSGKDVAIEASEAEV
ncbi:hypothetical protein QEH52_01040 [Coraliomargarita sp. SDUM461003]|uniref:Uncharacterized protein n=1 Tax=Thalassobacterium maritimum TaxID=3041265 RepID=A0ABU1AS51_9BACT|nr:hypothetical protein [Coraliomargarita sp. SDUM461003]